MSAFPIKQPPADDGRFTMGLTFDVRDVLKKHGYDMSDFDGMDFLNLQQALFRFLYSEHDS
jgi:hypothetical protein